MCAYEERAIAEIVRLACFSEGCGKPVHFRVHRRQRLREPGARGRDYRGRRARWDGIMRRDQANKTGPRQGGSELHLRIMAEVFADRCLKARELVGMGSIDE